MIFSEKGLSLKIKRNLKEMKYILSAIIALVCLFSFGQDCSSLRLSQPGDVQVIIKGPESGECFNFYVNRKKMNEQLTNELTFNIVSEDFRINDSLVLIKGRVVMADGNETKKNINLPEGFKSHLFEIELNKKGKCKLKRKFSGMVPTEETLAKREEDKKEFFEEHDRKVAEAKAKREADDAAWDAKQEKKRAEMKQRMADHEGAKLSDYEDTIQGRKGADHKLVEGAKHEPVQGADHKLIEGAKYEPIQGADHKLVEGRNEQLVQGQKSTFDDQPSNFNSAFDDETNDENSNPSSILNPKGEEVVLVMQLLYKGIPVENTHLTLEINKVKLGTGTTDSEGKITIKTSLPVDMNTAFRLAGKKGNYNWAFSGIQLLNFPPKTTKVDMAIIIQTVSNEMGTSAETLSRGWGFISE